MSKRSISFTLTTDGKEIELTRSGRKTPLASAGHHPESIAWALRRLAFYALEQAHWAETHDAFYQEPFTAEALQAQIGKLSDETECLIEEEEEA